MSNIKYKLAFLVLSQKLILKISAECYCSNTYGSYGLATNCNMPCLGNRIQVCGGDYANSVYSTSKVSTSSQSK